MIRSDLVQLLQKRLKHRFDDKSDVKLAVDEIIEFITQGLQDSNRIEIRGFGSFTPKTLPKRNSRNPKTGETFELAPRNTVQFKTGKELRELVDQSRDTHSIE